MNNHPAHTTCGLTSSSPLGQTVATVPGTRFSVHLRTGGKTQGDERLVRFQAALRWKKAVSTCLVLVGAFLATGVADAAAVAGTPATWSAAFPATGGPRPLHLQASFPGKNGRAHVLEFWRNPAGRVVRRTDGQVELRLTPAADGEDAYQLRDFQKHVV